MTLLRNVAGVSQSKHVASITCSQSDRLTSNATSEEGEGMEIDRDMKKAFSEPWYEAALRGLLPQLQ